ncbi:MAG: hypothetical protein LBK00_00550 [Treponema sp.]|jgi:hypothetical protein|nr:hypothetical protein [Treponema sp.]
MNPFENDTANWKAELVDFKSLIQAVATGQLPDTALLPNMPALNQMTKAYHDTREIPDVRQFNDITQAKRYA